MEMRFLKPFISCAMFAGAVHVRAYAGDIIYTDKFGDRLTVVDDIRITHNTTLDFENIYIGQSIYLHNMGNIIGAIQLCDGCDLYITNSGNISGEIRHGKDSTITQIIHNSSDMTQIRTDTSYNIMMQNADNIRLRDMYSISADANKITIDNSTLVLNDAPIMERMRHAPLELRGENTIIITDADIYTNIPLLQNVTGNGTVRVHVINQHPMFAATTYLDDGNIYLRMVRETDYMKILGGKTGEYLNRLRKNNPNDKLLQHLDRATDMPQLHHIMNKSMRLHPNRLARPLNTVMRHMAANEMMHGAQTQPFRLTGNNLDSVGIRTTITGRISDTLTMSAGALISELDFTDEIDDYTARMLGGDVALRYIDNRLFVQSGIGGAIAHIHTPPLVSGQNTPRATFIFANTDTGPRFDWDNTITITPSIGIGAEYSGVTQYGATMFARTGIMMEHTHKTSDIIYKYTGRTTADSLGRIDITASVAATSPGDEISTLITLGATHDDMGMSYSISTSATLHF